ncbi:MAG TPA: TetR/AcrR family transcriptional regulator [Ktedonobacterales bacterium]
MDDQLQAKPKKTWTHRGDNRQRLIAAGYTILAEKGVEAATVKEIALLAGVSPGLFHYHFESKDELLLAVLWEAGRRFAEQLRQDLQEALKTQPFPAVALVKAHEVGHKDPAWYRLRYELFALGLRKPAFLPAVGDYLAKTRQTMTQTITALTGMEEARARDMAMVMLACVDGLALQQLAQPGLDMSAAYALVQTLFSVEPEPLA